QAEDGIRDFHVTGVQTCALPILKGSRVAWCNLLKHLNLFFRLLPLVESHQHVDQGQSCQNIGAFVLQQISEERAGLVESAEVQGDRKSVVQGKSGETGGHVSNAL